MSEEPKHRLTYLLSIEKAVQEGWEQAKVYEAEPKYDDASGKFFGTFPYPYVNGLLHLGHAFTLTKVEFQARYQRLLGKNVLWPLSFHGTGMPILACANKLKEEFSASVVEDEKPTLAPVGKNASEEVVDVFRSKKTKAVAKKDAAKTQSEILIACGVKPELVERFQDPNYWLEYFPPLCRANLTSFGAAIDWRRSFVTTERNLFYDRFVRWQFNKLREMKYIYFGSRPCIYSRRDCQPCADHDRACGEGVMPQEYLIIKLAIDFDVAMSHPTLKKLQHLLMTSERSTSPNVYMLAATLRPETMYGQTNCFAAPHGTYGLYAAVNVATDQVEAGGVSLYRSDHDKVLKNCKAFYICSERCAWNLAFQGRVLLATKTNELIRVATFAGEDLLGIPLNAPLSVKNPIYVFPMESIDMTKGSAIVTSVPGDSVHDYVTLQHLKDKKIWLKAPHLKASMFDDLDCVELLDYPTYGRCVAKKVVEDLKLTYNDAEKLNAAKALTYKEAHYSATMVYGPYSTMKAMDAKPLIKADLIKADNAFVYYEPEALVMSRSGSECVVALSDQWYLDYNNPAWKQVVLDHINNPEHFATYPRDCLPQLSHIVTWLREWACSRSFGLGTRLPWDDSVLIESLSDSTIYMAFYTIAHHLFRDYDGKDWVTPSVGPETLTDAVFDYIFGLSDICPSETSVPQDLLKRMRREFHYWYPVDVRVSGKDLLFNHLPMSLLNHAAMWKNPKLWPRSLACNGLVLVDGNKMSKSQGNFLTLEDTIQLYTADGTRIALADAGDTLDDANFSQITANSALLRLYNMETYISQVISKEVPCRDTGKHPEMTWADLACQNEAKVLAQEAKEGYDQYQYRRALKAAFYNMTTLREQYKLCCGNKLIRHDVMMELIKTQLIILSPIAPHLTQHLWSKIHKDIPTWIVNEQFPALDCTVNTVQHYELQHLFGSLEDFRKLRSSGAKAPRDQPPTDPQDPTSDAIIYVAKEYNDWQSVVLDQLNRLSLTDPNEHQQQQQIPTDPISAVRRFLDTETAFDSKTKSTALAFASYKLKKELPVQGPVVLRKTPLFSEYDLFQTNHAFIAKSLNVRQLEIRYTTEGKDPRDSTKRIDTASPLKPAIVYMSL